MITFSSSGLSIETTSRSIALPPFHRQGLEHGALDGAVLPGLGTGEGAQALRVLLQPPRDQRVDGVGWVGAVRAGFPGPATGEERDALVDVLDCPEWKRPARTASATSPSSIKLWMFAAGMITPWPAVSPFCSQVA
jgi:hypothetical protein